MGVDAKTPAGNTPAALKPTSMKKFYSLCVLLCIIGASSCLISSCSSDGEGDTPPALPGNSFVYGDTEHKIESVVYAVDETGKIYSFYFSPTPGLVDLDAMLVADDYIKIVTNTPTGEINLLASGNQLLYKKLDISSATGDNVQKAVLTLQLTSLTTAKMSLDAATKDGATLRAEYNGLCIKQGGEDPETPTYDVTLTSQIFGYYMGPQEGADTNQYYMALTNAEFELTGGTKFNVKSEGYVLMLDFFGATGENWRDMPTGTFSESAEFKDHTYYNTYSFLSYYNANGKRTDYQIADAVKIECDEAGNGTVTATYLDAEYGEHKLIYTGNLKMANATLGVSQPQLDRDITIEGAYAEGVYSGDTADKGTGLAEITIYDQKAENNEPNGSAMKIAVFAEKFTDPLRDRRLIAGTYKAATTYKQFTWMPAVEMNFMGMIVPMGTYAAYDDGTKNTPYAYAKSGDIVIRDGSKKNHYTIEFELESIAGYKISGSYTGEVYLEDQSRDNTNDGTSSLKDDYELNFDYLSKHNANRAECYPQSEMWVRGLETVPVSTACGYSGREYGLQHIVIGKEIYEVTDEYPLGGGWDGEGKGKLVEYDKLGIDLLVEKGNEDKLATGTYSITPDRYPTYFYPGVCVCGYNCYYGTSMTFTTSAIGWGYPAGYYDPEYKYPETGWLNRPTIGEFASIYSGKIVVEKADGGDNWYTISVDGQDVLKHRITGTWTGPVYLGGTDTPVVQPVTAMQTSVKPSAPSYREASSAIREQLRNIPIRHAYKQ